MKKIPRVSGLILTLLYGSLSAQANVILGDDDRKQIWQITDPAVKVAASATAAMVYKKRITDPLYTKEAPSSQAPIQERWSFEMERRKAMEGVEALRMDPTSIFEVEKKQKCKTDENGVETCSDQMLCKSETFVDEPSSANCTGFLITDRHIMTAAHCVKMDRKSKKILPGKDDGCSHFNWVFDYHIDSQDGKFNPELNARNVYGCKSIVINRARHVPISFTTNFGMRRFDVAVVELDRPVKDRVPLQLADSNKPAVGTKVYTIGYPYGLPQKITENGRVVKGGISGKYGFATTLDTFSGNSGGPILDAKNHKVVGVMIQSEDIANPVKAETDSTGREIKCATFPRLSEPQTDSIRDEMKIYQKQIKALTKNGIKTQDLPAFSFPIGGIGVGAKALKDKWLQELLQVTSSR